MPVYFKINSVWLAVWCLTMAALLVFTVYVTGRSAQYLKLTADYRQISSAYQLWQTKIALAAAKQKQFKEHIHSLKIQAEELRELLNFEDWPLNNGKAAYPLIATHRIVSPQGEFGRVLIDNNIVIEYFDDGNKPLAFQRALVTAEKLKGLLAGQATPRKFTLKKTGGNVYAYINAQPVFVVLPADIQRLTEPLSAEKLARYWLTNIKTALAKPKQPRRLADSLPLFNKERRQQSRLYKTLYPSINYPAYALLLDTAAAGNQQIQLADHLLKLSRQEIVTYGKSFTELKNDMQFYKQRLDYTPSIFPVRNSYILSDFGWRHHPILMSMRFHSGVDIPSWQGAPIYATAAGVVIKTGWSAGYGNYIELDHGSGFSTLYGHNSANLVETGQQIRKGQIIARVGSTGLSEGDHCHYEVHYYDRPVNPVKFLNLNIFTAQHSW